MANTGGAPTARQKWRATLSKCPVVLCGVLMRMDRSTARRSVTGVVNVTTTGCATPTTAPLAGDTDATPGIGWSGGTAAVAMLTDSAVSISVIATTTDR
ncbi:hypothetical protein MRGA327_00770 [Mycobacterium tuberculosis RGTB327]|nr:hypothetical protein MRGA327_00770 [Mycobacterium tuberculosis RGTB327]